MSAPNTYVEFLTRKVTILGSRALRRCLDQEDGAPVSGAGVLTAEAPETPHSSSTMQGHSKEVLAISFQTCKQ